MKIVLDTNGKAVGYMKPIFIPTTKGEKEFINSARLPNGGGCRPWVYKTLQWVNGFGFQKYILENPLDTSDWDCLAQCCIDDYEAADAAIYDYAKNDQEWFDGEQPEALFGYTPSNVCLLSLYHLFNSNKGKVKMMAKGTKHSRKFARIKKLYAHLEELRDQYIEPKYMTFAHEKEVEEERKRQSEGRRYRQYTRHMERFDPWMMEEDENEN